MANHIITISVPDKETDLVKLLADGYTLPEIAVKIGMNRRTLEAKIIVLKQKYKSQTLANLVAVFLRNKLID